MSLLDQIKAKAKANPQTIVLPESVDERTIEAAVAINKEGIAKVVLLGAADAVQTSATKLGVSLDGIAVIDPATNAKLPEYAENWQKFANPKA